MLLCQTASLDFSGVWMRPQVRIIYEISIFTYRFSTIPDSQPEKRIMLSTYAIFSFRHQNKPEFTNLTEDRH